MAAWVRGSLRALGVIFAFVLFGVVWASVVSVTGCSSEASPPPTAPIRPASLVAEVERVGRCGDSWLEGFAFGICAPAFQHPDGTYDWKVIEVCVARVIAENQGRQ